MKVPERRNRTTLEVLIFERNATTDGRASPYHDRERWDIVVFALGRRE